MENLQTSNDADPSGSEPEISAVSTCPDIKGRDVLPIDEPVASVSANPEMVVMGVRRRFRVDL